MLPMENGMPVPRPVACKRRVRYLGLHFGPDKPFESCSNELLLAGQRYMYALYKDLKVRVCFPPASALRCLKG